MSRPFRWTCQEKVESVSLVPWQKTSEISMMSPEFPPGILPGPLLEVWQKPTFGLKLGVIK